VGYSQLKVKKLIDKAFLHYRKTEYDKSKKILSSLSHPHAFYILGLIEYAQSQYDTAARYFQKAHSGDKNNYEILYNLGLSNKQLGKLSEAISNFEKSIKLRKNYSPALKALARVNLDTENWLGASNIYTQLLKTHPDDQVIIYGLAISNLELGHLSEADDLINSLCAGDNISPNIYYLRARIRVQKGELDAAIDDLVIALSNEKSALSFKLLAEQYWNLGRHEDFNQIIQEALSDQLLVLTALDLLNSSGQAEKSAEMLQKADNHASLSEEALMIYGQARITTNEADSAEAIARRCLALNPKNVVAMSNLISSLLMQGQAGEALEKILIMRSREPFGQHWIAYETIALKILKDPKYEVLNDFDKFVQAFELPIPRGFSSIKEFNQAFRRVLEDYNPYSHYPLGQSVRGGSQTELDLAKVDHEVIRAYIEAIDTPIKQYLSIIGYAAEHPLLSRNMGKYSIAGCWSVTLQGQGNHINHVHPQGWISSSYYIEIPESLEPDKKQGWIKFGEPPFETQPKILPQKWIQPKSGLIVLFPSYMWHGTVPTTENTIRITAPFDLVPK